MRIDKMTQDSNATYLLSNALKVPEISVGIYSVTNPKQFSDSFVPWDHSGNYRLRISEILGKNHVETHEWKEVKKPGINFHKNKFKTHSCATFTFIAVRKPDFPYLIIDGNKRLVALLEILNESPSLIKHMDIKAVLIESQKMEQMANDDYKKVLDRLKGGE